MKKIVLIMVVAVMSLDAGAQWFAGWSERTGLVLSLHLTDSLPELYSPMQTEQALPVSQSSQRGDTLNIVCSDIGFSVTLVQRDSCLAGSWRQGVVREEIVFEPADTLYRLLRPQTPLRPYRFEEEEVTVDYRDSQGNAVHLEGTLALPRGKKRCPTVVLISGSGQQNRDEEIMFHKPFLVLADYLAAQGVATLRYDDRGVGGSTGSLDSADTRLFAEDAEQMFKVAKRHRRVDGRRLGMAGHSEGAAIAAIVAARNRDVAFVVMMSGQGCSGYDVLLQQNEAIYAANGVSQQLCDARVACMRDIMSLPVGSKQRDYKGVIDLHTATLTAAQTDSIGLGRGAAYQMMQQMSTRWMREFLRIDPADFLPQVKCPILAVGGEKDRQVLAEPNMRRIRDLTQHRATCRVLPGLNHLLQHCDSGSPSEYVRIEETIAPEAMQIMADWILATRR